MLTPINTSHDMYPSCLAISQLYTFLTDVIICRGKHKMLMVPADEKLSLILQPEASINAACTHIQNDIHTEYIHQKSIMASIKVVFLL